MQLERFVEHEPTVEWGQKDLALYESCHSYEHLSGLAIPLMEDILQHMEM